MPLPAILGGMALGGLAGSYTPAAPGRAHFVPIEDASLSPDGEPVDRKRRPDRRREREGVLPPELVDRRG